MERQKVRIYDFCGMVENIATGSVKISQKAVSKLLQKQQRRTGEKYILFLLKSVSCTYFVKSSTDGIAFCLSHCTIPEERDF